MSLRLALAAVALAIFAEATGGDIEPDWLYAVIVPVWIIGAVGLGVAGRSRAIVPFAVAWAAAAVVHELWFYDAPVECDPMCGSPAEGIGLVLPIYVLLIATGAGARAIGDRVAVRRRS